MASRVTKQRLLPCNKPKQRPFLGPKRCQRQLASQKIRAQKGRGSEQSLDSDLSRRAALALGAGVTLSGALPSGKASATDQPASNSMPSSALTEAVPSSILQAVPHARTAEGAALARANDTVPVGQSGLVTSPIGIGAWSWGDRSGYWGYGDGYTKETNAEAYQALIASKIGLIDTSEVYGFGLSEEFIGEFMRNSGTSPAIATKFAPLPWRFTSGSVVDACKASLKRLGIEKMALYQQHWPAFGPNFFCSDAFIEGLADCQIQGLTEAVGVSNFKADRVRSASQILQDRGVALASNQVQYSLLYRSPEQSGVADAVRDAGATLIAYSPLCQGLLTGKYTKDNLPGGARKLVINEDRITAVQPLLSLMRDIGEANGGKTCGQVAINWTICKGAIPIPGAKNAKQASEAAGGFGWRMSDDQVAALDKQSDKIAPTSGAPFEKW